VILLLILQLIQLLNDSKKFGAPRELIPPGPTKEGIYTQIEKRWNLYPFGGGTYTQVERLQKVEKG